MCLNFISFFFFFKAEQESIVCIQNILFIHSPVNGYLGFSHLLTVVWLMILWSWFYRYLLKYLFLILLGIFPAIKLVEHVIILVLNFLRSCYTIFHSGYNFFTLKEHNFWWTVNYFCNSHAYQLCDLVILNCPPWVYGHTTLNAPDLV